MRIAVLDDYQGVALAMADWTPVLQRCEVTVFRDHVADPAALVARLLPFEAVVVMRERTPLTAAVLLALPRLRLIVTTGRKNASIDTAAARAQGVVVCGTESLGSGPSELTWALILGLSRHLVVEAAAVRAGQWQSTVGRDLAGRTLGVVGLGRIGSQVAKVGLAFDMDVVAWSENLTLERAAEVGVRPAPGLADLLRESDVVTIHQVLSDRTRGLIGAAQLALMKPDALLVNTSRGAIFDQAALISALESGHLAGAGLDVFDEEPLPADHPLRTAPRTLLTPHLGYVTEDIYRTFFTGVVEDLMAFLEGKPIRELP